MFDTALPSTAVAPPPEVTRIARSRPLALIGIGAWLVPGLGHVFMGRFKAALVMFTAIAGLYAGGLLLTDATCVNFYSYRLEFFAQIFAGGPTLAALHYTEGLEVTRFLPNFEVGRLYVAVAGLLNVVAISDALSLALSHNAQVEAATQLREDLAWQAEQDRLDAQRTADHEADLDMPALESPEHAGAVFPPFGWTPDDEPPSPDTGGSTEPADPTAPDRTEPDA